MSTKERIEFLQGTLDLLILRTLLFGPVHGHAIAKAIEFNSDQVLQVEQRSLYPALHRLSFAHGAPQWLTAINYAGDTLLFAGTMLAISNAISASEPARVATYSQSTPVAADIDCDLLRNAQLGPDAHQLGRVPTRSSTHLGS